MTEPREEALPLTPDMLVARPQPGPIDFERGMRLWPPLILFLIAANVAMFGWEVAAGALTDRDTIIEAGALVRDRVLAGEWWRLVSSAFLHANVNHLIGNCVVLYIVGMACEHALGFAQTAAVYFASAIGGSALSIAVRPGPSVGASGAIFGVLTAVVVVLYRNRNRYHLRDKRIGWVLGVWAAWQVLTGFLNPLVDNFAHLGGLAAGGATALACRPRLLARSASR
ncbi:MAG TPA: rhomboid family intramembrane serine protease [Gemmatimonadales bacterium]